MTTTAHEDQFTEWTQWAAAKRAEVNRMVSTSAETEAEAIAAWLDRHGYREIATRIRAGEYRA